MTAADFLSFCLGAGLLMVTLAAALTFLRLARGPSLADRVVALDMITAAVIAFCGLFALVSGVAAYLDIAVTLALVSFVSVIALARYAERQARKGDRQ